MMPALEKLEVGYAALRLSASRGEAAIHPAHSLYDYDEDQEHIVERGLY